MTNRPRVAYLLYEYPQTSQTYVKAELEAVAVDHDVVVLATREAPVPYVGHLPYTVVETSDQAVELLQDFQPQVLHTHWLQRQMPVVFEVAQKLQIPFTVRSHSFEFSWGGRGDLYFERAPALFRRTVPGKLTTATDIVRDEQCVGILAFPYLRKRLRALRVQDHKIHDAFPVVDVQRFLDRSPNGEDVICTGASMASKRIQDFFGLSNEVPGRAFNFYPVDNPGRALGEKLVSEGARVNIYPVVAPNAMPAVYKQHQWMVKTAHPRPRRVGWPVSVAEAQASGVGVCMIDLGPDLREFLGNAGYVYSSPAEIRDIIARPFDGERREEGFELAKRYDIRETLPTLTDLWKPYLA